MKRSRLWRLLDRDREIFSGWAPDEEACREFVKREQKPFFRQHSSAIQGSGKKCQVMLWKYFEKVTSKPFQPRFQKLGDCVGQATGLAVDALGTVEIGLKNEPERWQGECSTEAIYAGSRIEVGRGRACFNRWGRPTDGSNGVWAARYVRDYGTLLRDVYGDVDLTRYRPDLARLWGSSNEQGVPDELELISRQHRVRTIARVEGWDEACDAVGNGFPVLVCSGLGYYRTAQGDGFHEASRKPTWHAWLLWGVDSLSKSEGGCIASSWGDCFRGPHHKLGTPTGCFWASARNIDRMLGYGDSYALSNFEGFPSQEKVRYQLW